MPAHNPVSTDEPGGPDADAVPVEAGPGHGPVRRRERLRQTTVAEIKALAWQQIAEAGAPSLSLRAIARDMGMTSSALYRYFPSREVLLTALIKDGFASLADALEAAEAEVAGVAESGE